MLNKNFWNGYLMAIGFTARDFNGEILFECDGGAFDDNYSPEDIERHLTFDEIVELKDDCNGFIERCKEHDIVFSDDKMYDVGMNFHFSRNGHGTGFFDSEFPKANLLQRISKEFGEFELTK